MSTRDSIYYIEDDAGNYCHIYWELADRVVEKGRTIAAPIFLSLGPLSKLDENPIRLPPDIARKICEKLGINPGESEII
ncbi:hypothetical protein AYO50_01150 [Acidobacteria bacterium SCGC AG-212-P17]|nr:hypothetical protein AYO50_01150 [Acidobacteria bacterium SCGC AG-212-P17]